jgi:hypothetical protein
MQMSYSQQIPDIEMSCGSKQPSSKSANPAPPTSAPVEFNADKIVYIKVAVHFLLPTNNITQTISYGAAPNTKTLNYSGPGNFTETSDGDGGSYTGFQFAEDLIKNANARLANNIEAQVKNPSLPNSYYTPPPTLNFRYLLVAVFFHRDDAIYNVSGLGGISTIHAKYDYMGNQVMDIYQSPMYNPGNLAGEALSLGGGNKAVVDDDYFSYLIDKSIPNIWAIEYGIPGLLNHEIGHMLGLAHTWDGDDECEDTPMGVEYTKFEDETTPNICSNLKKRVNCWQWNMPPSDLCKAAGTVNPCADIKNVTNNVMDYTAAWPSKSYTPCQVDKINTDLKLNGGTYIRQCQGNCPPPNAFFWINGERFNNCANPNLPINFVGVGVNEKWFQIRVSEMGVKGSMPIITSVGEAGNINLANLYNFKGGRTYTISLRVDNPACGTCMDVYSKTISFEDCPTKHYPPVSLVATNPFGTNIYVNLDYTREGQTRIQLVNQLTSDVIVLQNENHVTADRYNYEFDTTEVAPGNYTLQVIFDGQIYFQNLVKVN